MVFFDRTPRQGDRWLLLKVWCFALGAALAFAGVYLRRDWLVWSGVGVLVIGFGARFLDRRSREEG